MAFWGSGAQDGNGYGIVGRKFSADGTALSGEFLVNTYVTGNQNWPSVTALQDGGFFVAWHSQDQDGNGYGIYGQRYNAVGSKFGGEIQVNSYTTSDQTYPRVVTLANGNIVATWMSMGQDAASTYGSYARIFSASGVALTGEIQVNVTTAGTQYYPVVTGLADGSFVIAWYDSSAAVAPGSGTDITARRFAADGTAMTGEFRVNLANVTNNQYKPTMAALSDGGFVVAWYTYSGAAFNAIMAQRFDANGTAGESYTVATFAYNNTADNSPSITALSDGGFAVGWTATAISKPEAEGGSEQGLGFGIPDLRHGLRQQHALDGDQQVDAQLHRRGTQILAEHRRQILRRLDGANKGIARDRAEGGQHRGGVHHALGSGHSAGLHGIGQIVQFLTRQARGVTGGFEHGFEAQQRLLGGLHFLEALAQGHEHAAQRRTGSQADRPQAQHG